MSFSASKQERRWSRILASQHESLHFHRTDQGADGGISKGDGNKHNKDITIIQSHRNGDGSFVRNGVNSNNGGYGSVDDDGSKRKSSKLNYQNNSNGGSGTSSNKRNASSINTNQSIGTSLNCKLPDDPSEYYAGPVTRDACRCPHLDAVLPLLLDSGGIGSFDARHLRNNQDKQKKQKLLLDGISAAHTSSLIDNDSLNSYHGHHTNNKRVNTNNNDMNSGKVPTNQKKKSTPKRTKATTITNKSTKENAKNNSHQSNHEYSNKNSIYPCGEEEFRTDIVSTSGIMEYYSPLLPPLHRQLAHQQRLGPKLNDHGNGFIDGFKGEKGKGIKEFDKEKQVKTQKDGSSKENNPENNTNDDNDEMIKTTTSDSNSNPTNASSESSKGASDLPLHLKHTTHMDKNTTADAHTNTTTSTTKSDIPDTISTDCHIDTNNRQTNNPNDDNFKKKKEDEPTSTTSFYQLPKERLDQLHTIEQEIRRQRDIILSCRKSNHCPTANKSEGGTHTNAVTSSLSIMGEFFGVATTEKGGHKKGFKKKNNNVGIDDKNNNSSCSYVDGGTDASNSPNNVNNKKRKKDAGDDDGNTTAITTTTNTTSTTEKEVGTKSKVDKLKKATFKNHRIDNHLLAKKDKERKKEESSTMTILINRLEQKDADVQMAMSRVEEWLEVIRQNRLCFWSCTRRKRNYYKNAARARDRYCIPNTPVGEGQAFQKLKFGAGFGSSDTNNSNFNLQEPSCQYCPPKNDDYDSDDDDEKSCQSHVELMLPKGDELMQCLDCSLIACGPSSLSTSFQSYQSAEQPQSIPQNQHQQHLLQHFLLSGHNFGMTCGPMGKLFCMKCGDFVYSQVIDDEKDRLAIRENVPWLGWDKGALVQRSFMGDNFIVLPDLFVRSEENGAASLVVNGATNKASTGSSLLKGGRKGNINADTISKEGKDKNYDGGCYNPENNKSNNQNDITWNSGMVMWRGFKAVYPHGVCDELVQVGRLTLRRRKIFNGELDDDIFLKCGPKALHLSLAQLRHLRHNIGQEQQRHKPQLNMLAPVGMYNLGNTCFMSSVLQCLVHCRPLQTYFLYEVKHDHCSCKILTRKEHEEKMNDQCRSCDDENGRRVVSEEKVQEKTVGMSPMDDKDDMSLCLGCEMDKLFLTLHGSSVGVDALAAIQEPIDPTTPFMTESSFAYSENVVPPFLADDNKTNLSVHTISSSNSDNSTILQKVERINSTETGIDQGMPIIPSNLLAAAWKCVGMTHLAGYEQRDAHEFLQAFLDIMGKHCYRYNRISKRMSDEAKAIYGNEILSGERSLPSKSEDIIKNLFGGTLRSVLICERCGHKRSQPEAFLNVSLPLSKELLTGKKRDESGTRSIGTRNNSKGKIHLKSCLQHFTLPEALTDVHCPSCAMKTPTQKQHTFAKLPKILCFHLKRFDAVTNRKITDHVTFPVNLNMGPHLPHWCEVIPGIQSAAKVELGSKSNISSNDDSYPNVIYDLYGTINHTGTLHQGHYVSNVKVHGQWYHCNDAFVSKNEEADVLKSEGVYMIFYIRR